MPVNWQGVISVSISAAIMGILIYCIITAVKWWNSPDSRPVWFAKIINTFNPVYYNYLPEYQPFLDSKSSVVNDSSSKTANTCSFGCTNSSKCNGFIFDSQLKKCTRLQDDFGTYIMIPSANVDTYVKTTSNLPKWGFIEQGDGIDFTYNSKLVSQRLGSELSGTDVTIASSNCIAMSSSNCLGFSVNTLTSKYQLSKGSNTETTSNVQSYALDYVPETDFLEVSF